MRNALSELASINSQTSAHLREILESLGVQSNYGNGAAKSSARGTAHFTAFHPENTCLRFPPLTVRFFQDAVKFSVFTNAEAQEISFQMAACCRRLAQEYKGAFSTTLGSGVFRDFLTGSASRNDFLHKESVHGWCVDAFAADFPWPVMPDIHLRTTGYRLATVSKRALLGRGRGSFLRFMHAVDIAAFGACTGLSVKDASEALSWLHEPPGSQEPEDIVLTPDGTAERLIMPFFSYGFQGAVFGFFNGLQPDQKEHVFKALILFGQSLADNYAYFRRNDCLRKVQQSRDAASLASALLGVMSPVETLIVEKDGRFHAYSLEREDGYWAGYVEHRGHGAAELSRELLLEGKCSQLEQSCLGERFRLIVKPVQDQQSLDPVFSWISLQARLSEILHVPGAAARSDPLTLEMLMAQKEALESKIVRSGHEGVERSRGDFGRLKRLCIIELIIENFERGEIELTNNTLKSRLEKKLGPRASVKLNGYQIAGRALQRVRNEFSEDFRSCVKFDPAGHNKVRLSWTRE
jgi:hypothetical protein